MTALLANRKLLRALLPVLSLAIVLIATFYAQPRAMSYFGLNLMLQYAVPIALATIAQLFVITVNDHFRGGAPTLAPGGRLTAPLSGFQTAFGQRFDHARQSVAKIELTATDADGGAVALNWVGGKVQ